ncbi:hypothetical protein [Clavibacter michiganensis]|uniref:Uncharacterized protein n=1 Tax=Clavibacter michiganensis TaxID=28447 RepID=A0A251YVN4_9MICO|nr:hypothetical protein [Clavibacter michiganensis]OUE28285.1 hypothetical protein BFL37_00305 [Clavibacter michiganensis]
MSSATPSTRPSRRLRRAGPVAAGAAIALSAVVGLGIAPASAADAFYPFGTDHVRVHTHWLSSGVNVRSIRVTGPIIIQNGKSHATFDRCFSMGNDYRPGVEKDRTIAIDLPSNVYTVVGYADGACRISEARTGGGASGVPSSAHDWTISPFHGVSHP